MGILSVASCSSFMLYLIITILRLKYHIALTPHMCYYPLKWRQMPNLEKCRPGGFKKCQVLYWNTKGVMQDIAREVRSSKLYNITNSIMIHFNFIQWKPPVKLVVSLIHMHRHSNPRQAAQHQKQTRKSERSTRKWRRSHWMKSLVSHGLWNGK